MPANFDRCVADGGKVRTLPGNRLICFPKGGGDPIVVKRESQKRLKKGKKIESPNSRLT